MQPYLYTVVEQEKLHEMLEAFYACLDLPIQVIPIFFLLSGHLFIKGCIQIIGIHVIAPPHAVLVSCLYCGASPDASGCPAPKSVCFWQQQPLRAPVPFRRC